MNVETCYYTCRELEKAGFIYTVAGKGCFVAARNTELLREENLRRMEERMEEIRRLALSCGMNREETIKMFEIIWEEET